VEKVTDPDLLRLCWLIGGSNVVDDASGEYRYTDFSHNPAVQECLDIVRRLQSRLSSEGRKA
jgi:hypothetical protein